MYGKNIFFNGDVITEAARILDKYYVYLDIDYCVFKFNTNFKWFIIRGNPGGASRVGLKFNRKINTRVDLKSSSNTFVVVRYGLIMV